MSDYYTAGETIKTQDTYYEYILVVRDVATSDDGKDVVLRAEVVRSKLLNYNVAIPADWPRQKNGTFMSLIPEEVSLYEGEDLPDLELEPLPPAPEGYDSLPGNVYVQGSMPGHVYSPHPVVLLDEDPVNHPSHYTSHPSGVECIQITEHMGFNMGNALKYIWRADLKNGAVEDINKAIFYLNRELEKRNGS